MDESVHDLDEPALGRRGTAADDRFDDGAAIGLDVFRREGELAAGDVQVGGLVELELNATGFAFLDRLGGVVGDGAGLGIRHQTARPEHAAQLADFGHRFRRRHGDIEILEAFGDFLDQVFKADKFRTGGLGGFGGGALGEHQHADVLARTGGERDGAAHHLVALLRIDAQLEGEIDRLVALGGGDCLRSFTASAQV